MHYVSKVYDCFINGYGIRVYKYYVILNHRTHILKKDPPKMTYTKITKLHVRYKNVVYNHY